MLPGLEIKFDNGNIGAVVPTPDGLFGLAGSAVAVSDTFELDTPYLIKGMQDVAALGIIPDLDNHKLYTKLSEFYQEAGEGTELWLIGFAKSTKVSDWFTPHPNTGIAPVEKLLDTAKGAINMVFTSYDPLGSFTPTIVNSMEQDVVLAKQKAQALAENYITKKFSPIFTILEAYAFSGVHGDLPDLTEESNNRVGIFIGSSSKRTATVPGLGSANHILAARLANSQVHVNPGKVKDGPLRTLTAFVIDTPVELYDIEALHNKGYICFRTHTRKAGYYITDDPLATAPSDDYHYISRRRTIDKAYRIAFDVVSNEINNDFDIQNDGTISPFYAEGVQAAVESAIYNQMSAQGELSLDTTDKNDLAV